MDTTDTTTTNTPPTKPTTTPKAKPTPDQGYTPLAPSREHRPPTTTPVHYTPYA